MADDPECSAKGIPSHLHSSGRLPDQDFQETELLFRRVPLSTMDLTSAISFNKMSVNRGKYSQDGTDDVLWDAENGGRHVGFGVVQVSVGSIRQRKWRHPTLPVEYEFELSHVPEKCNYAHSEAAIRMTNLESATSEIVTAIEPPSVRLMIRNDFEGQLKILVPPDRRGEWLPPREE